MNLVKKTPGRLRWRLSTNLSYRRGETEGEIMEEEEESQRGLTLEGENCSPSASFFFQFPSSGWCLLSNPISSNRFVKLVQIQDKGGQRGSSLLLVSINVATHAHLFFSRILHKSLVKKKKKKRDNVNGKVILLLCTRLCGCVGDTKHALTPP